MKAAIAIGCAAAGTYGLRALFVTLVRPPSLPSALERALASAGPAVMAALAATHLAHPPATGGPGLTSRLLAVAAGALVAHRTRHLWVAMAAGMAVLWGLEVALG